MLLVSGEHERQPPSGRTVACQLGGGEEHRGHRALHVAGAESIQVAVVDAPDERVARPHRVADRFRVEVTAEGELASTGSEVEVDDEVGTARLGGEHSRRRQAQLGADVGDDAGGGALVTRWVGARRGDETLGQLDHVGFGPPFQSRATLGFGVDERQTA